LKQALVPLDDVFLDVDPPVTEVGERRPEVIFGEARLGLVDDAVLAFELHLGLGELGLIGPDEVVLQRLIDDHEALVDDLSVIGRAVLTQQKLEHVDGHVVPNLHTPNEVLAHDPPWEDVVRESVELLHLRHCSSSSRSSSNVDTGAATLTVAFPRVMSVRAFKHLYLDLVVRVEPLRHLEYEAHIIARWLDRS